MNLADGTVRNFAGSKSEDVAPSIRFLCWGGWSPTPPNHGRESDRQRFSASGSYSGGIPLFLYRRQIAFMSLRSQSKSPPFLSRHSLTAASAICSAMLLAL